MGPSRYLNKDKTEQSNFHPDHLRPRSQIVENDEECATEKDNIGVQAHSSEFASTDHKIVSPQHPDRDLITRWPTLRVSTAYEFSMLGG